jgi:DNA-binding response OmpR family regulator
MHALIIEDEFMIALAIEDVLRVCGFKTFDIALFSESAINAAAANYPDLITADVQLRSGCGIATVQRICSDPPIPVIFVTGNGADVRRKLPSANLLDKPFSEASLIAAVAVAMA